MATINFNGLASGLDTKTIVEQLTQIKQSQIITPISQQISLNRSRKSGLTPIQTALSALRFSSKTLNNADDSAYSKKKVDSSDSATVRITSVDSAKAVNGTYSITNISQLAQPDRVIFQGVANTGVSQFGTGTISITYKGVATNISIDSSNNTLDGIKSAINSASAGVTASIISDGSGATPYRLVLTSNDTGANTTITHNINSILSLSVDASSTDATNEPADASFNLNSITYTSHSNTISDAIQGVTFELLGTETTDTISLTTKQDTSAIIGNIQTFISSLNSARDALKKAINPDSNSQFGVLGHDRLLQDTYYEVGRLASRRVLSAGTYTSLADLGITADRNGTYTIDTGKLTAILEQDRSTVEKIFQGTAGENGIAENIYNYMDNLTNPLGVYALRQKQYDDAIKNLNSIIKERTVALQNYQTNLKNKFNKLETSISALKGQQDQLTGLATQIAGTGN